MTIKLAKKTLILANKLQTDVGKEYLPPSETASPKGEKVLFHTLVKNTRGYIEKIVYQINGTYEEGWYDACGVMIRRLI